MIDNDQITALAREYAEEATKDIPSDNDIKSLRESAIRLNAEGMEKHLHWLLRRFCLVEKDELTKCRQAILNKIKTGENIRRKKTIDEGKAQLSLFDLLFPDLGKEVEE